MEVRKNLSRLIEERIIEKGLSVAEVSRLSGLIEEQLIGLGSLNNGQLDVLCNILWPGLRAHHLLLMSAPADPSPQFYLIFHFLAAFNNGEIIEKDGKYVWAKGYTAESIH
jgi:hypothetical protein